MMAERANPHAVLDFWFGAGNEKWFVKDAEFDAAIERHFGDLVRTARRDGLTAWEGSPDSALAAVIVFDQFPRNIYRGEARAFASDARALGVAQRAIDHGFDMEMAAPSRRWFYMPFMHAEDLATQNRCVDLCRRGAVDDATLHSALEHADIIRRFGRFPHRNPILGRPSSEDEEQFLKSGGFSG